MQQHGDSREAGYLSDHEDASRVPLLHADDSASSTDDECSQAGASRSRCQRPKWTREEEMVLVEAHCTLGNAWVAIAECLPGRTPAEVKNIWHSTLRARKLQTRSVLRAYVTALKDRSDKPAVRQQAMRAAQHLQAAGANGDGQQTTKRASKRQAKPQRQPAPSQPPADFRDAAPPPAVPRGRRLTELDTITSGARIVGAAAGDALSARCPLATHRTSMGSDPSALAAGVPEAWHLVAARGSSSAAAPPAAPGFDHVMAAARGSSSAAAPPAAPDFDHGAPATRRMSFGAVTTAPAPASAFAMASAAKACAAAASIGAGAAGANPFAAPYGVPNRCGAMDWGCGLTDWSSDTGLAPSNEPMDWSLPGSQDPWDAPVGLVAMQPSAAAAAASQPLMPTGGGLCMESSWKSCDASAAATATTTAAVVVPTPWQPLVGNDSDRSDGSSAPLWFSQGPPTGLRPPAVVCLTPQPAASHNFAVTSQPYGGHAPAAKAGGVSITTGAGGSRSSYKGAASAGAGAGAGAGTGAGAIVMGFTCITDDELLACLGM